MASIISCASACGNSNNSDLLAVSQFEKFIQEGPGVTLLDVRTPEEFAECHIPGAQNIDFQSEGFVDAVESAISKDKTLAIYCRSGRRSAEAMKILQTKGFDVKDLDGGILAWEKVLLPVTDGTYDYYFTSDGKKIAIKPLIHASLRIVADGKEIEVDPVGKMGDRVTDYASFPKADLILVTHEHYDHLDPAAIKELSKPDTLVIANPNSAGILGYGEVMKNGDVKELAAGITVEAVPAYNTSADKLQFHPKGRDNGYVLTLDGVRIYIAGDTEVIPEMKDLKDIDIAFLPCNLPYTMTPEQVIEAARIIKPRVLYPYHYGTTDLSTLTPALSPDGIYVRICPFDPGSK